MKFFVHRSAILTAEQLPPQEGPRSEFVEVVVRSEGRCRRTRLAEVVPDIEAALHAVNGNIAVLVEEMQGLAKIVRRNGAGASKRKD